MFDVLLPNNATKGERALEQATARLGAVPTPIRPLWNPETCPAHLLPWLAWSLSVDDWDPDWPEATKRRVIAESVEIHRRKGTVASVKAILRAQGWVLDDPFFTTLHDDEVTHDGTATYEQPYFEFGAELIERYGHETYNGTHSHNGAVNHDDADHWAEYRLRIFRQITIDQAAAIRRAMATVAPARCHLRALNYPEALHRYNGVIAHDDTFTHGEA